MICPLCRQEVSPEVRPCEDMPLCLEDYCPSCGVELREIACDDGTTWIKPACPGCGGDIRYCGYDPECPVCGRMIVDGGCACNGGLYEEDP